LIPGIQWLHQSLQDKRNQKGMRANFNTFAPKGASLRLPRRRRFPATLRAPLNLNHASPPPKLIFNRQALKHPTFKKLIQRLYPQLYVLGEGKPSIIRTGGPLAQQGLYFANIFNCIRDILISRKELKVNEIGILCEKLARAFDQAQRKGELFARDPIEFGETYLEITQARSLFIFVEFFLEWCLVCYPGKMMSCTQIAKDMIGVRSVRRIVSVLKKEVNSLDQSTKIFIRRTLRHWDPSNPGDSFRQEVSQRSQTLQDFLSRIMELHSRFE